ncbi:bacillithiol biosynthesis cysteine-adding enzyme BshC [Virgibacillus halophilus]|uniref:Putative cysteine ligase BshC n=1 Tax=Tigheibacillus halophilus TaxID=361280 RepID=A0ABU5CB85_9BACI|nr:bacillithiol biosynthesis cysteine-adding enzyme BshC [Virgibacillus halophilus]
MQIDPIYSGKANKLVSDYRNDKQSIMQFFHYHLTEADFTNRVSDIKKRRFQREAIAEVLEKMNRDWGAPESAIANIKRLKRTDSVIVVGGQQAGVLTGPMYSIHKVISILQLARQQEKKLNIPVIPVFWIAGEDHDFEEINHVYMPSGQKLTKHKMPQRVIEKKSVSDIEINQADAERWLQDVFAELDETVHTKPIYTIVCDCLKQSKTYVDFFARFIFTMMENEGLVLLDSNHPEIRQLESGYFKQLITQQPSIASGVFEQMQCLKNEGYQVALDVGPEDGHLFFHEDKERILLKRDESGNWIGKQNQLVLSEKELLGIAENTPENLSNNVVTRPVMQELLLPTLAFVAGPGEIGYWSALKPAFETLDIKMPPVVQRLSFTFLDNNTEKLLKRYGIPLKEAVEEGVDHLKLRWLQAKTAVPVKEMAEEIKKGIAKIHQPLQEIAKDLRADLGAVADKNLFYIERNIDFVEHKIQQAVEEMNSSQVADFDRLDQVLHPLSGLQERTWNPLPLLNIYGTTLFAELSRYDCSFENSHYAVRI